jgi:hypothetical protein
LIFMKTDSCIKLKHMASRAMPSNRYTAQLQK